MNFLPAENKRAKRMTKTPNVVVAPQGFKGGLGGAAVGAAMRRGVLAVWAGARARVLPVADGGDGTLDVLLRAHSDNDSESESGKTKIGGAEFFADTTDALGGGCLARWGVVDGGKTAVMETAEACGLAKIAGQKRRPLAATTRGVGALFFAALDNGCKKFIVGVGGSATTDGGAGLAQMMGAKILDKKGRDIKPGGGHLGDICAVDISAMDARLAGVEIVAATDVTNALCGADGAAAVFAPQKGASAAEVEVLAAGLRRFADIVRRDLGADIAALPGGGAAGGLAAGLRAFFGAELLPGADVVLDAVGFDEAVRGADLLLVGEGTFDRSSAFNKAPVAAAKRAQKFGVPVLGVGGALGAGYEEIYQHGIGAVFSIADRPLSLAESIADAPQLIQDATARACRAFSLGYAAAQKKK